MEETKLGMGCQNYGMYVVLEWLPDMSYLLMKYWQVEFMEK